MNGFRRILVLVPHPDDEALLAAGIVRRAVLEGDRVAVALVTNGDYLCADHTKGQKRLRESIAAMQTLGVSQENIYLLGYPDTGFEPAVSFLSCLWAAQQAPHEVFASASSRETYALAGEHDDYCFARTGAHAPYTRAALCADLHALLAQTQPDLVITTAEADLHGDHAALFRFVRAALRDMLVPQPSLWVGMVHSPDGDFCWPRLTSALSEFEQPATDWGAALLWKERICVPLPQAMLPADDATINSEKYKLIESYRMALNPNEPEVCKYLLAFAKREEIFWAVTTG